MDTTVTFSTDGVYVLQLTVDDSEFTNFDEVTITVNSIVIPNQAPTVDAGLDQSINVANGVSLDGTVTDDGLPNPPGTVTSLWGLISGPGTATFLDDTAVDTTVTFSTDGVYVLQLTVDDSEFTNFDEVTITVNSIVIPNQAPTVDAGLDQSINVANGVSLDGTVTDDGLPNPPGTVTSLWGLISGPGTATFLDDTAVDTTVTFSTDGVYVLQLTVDDSEFTNFDEVTITVNSIVIPNQAPTVDAGLDQSINVANGVSLDGTVTDDGLPNPPGTVTSLWGLISGPGTATFLDDTAVDTTVTFSTDGVYVLQLTVDDSEFTNFDEVTIYSQFNRHSQSGTNCRCRTGSEHQCSEWCQFGWHRDGRWSAQSARDCYQSLEPDQWAGYGNLS